MNIIGVELGVARAAKQLEHIVKPHLDSEGRPIIPTKLHEALKIRAANAVSDATNMTMRQSMPSLVNGTDDDSSSLESQREDYKAFQLGARDVITSRQKLHQLQRIYSRRKSKALRGLETRNTEKRNKLLENVESDLNKALSHLDKIIKVKDEYKKRLKAAKTLLALASTANNGAITSFSGGKLEIDTNVMQTAYGILMQTLPDRYTVRDQSDSSKGQNADSDSREEIIDQIVAELDTEIEVLRSEVENHKVEADLESAIIEYLEDGGKDEVERMRKNKDAQGFDKLVTENLEKAMSDVEIKDKDKIMERVKQRVMNLYDIPIRQLSEHSNESETNTSEENRGDNKSEGIGKDFFNN